MTYRYRGSKGGWALSIQAVAWVLGLDRSVTGTERFVLVSLANHAGINPRTGKHEAWPSLALIAREVGLAGTEPVRRALMALEAAGVIERHVRAAPDERIPADRRPNLYRFPMLDDPPSQRGSVDDPPSQRVTTPLENDDDPPCERVTTPLGEGGKPSLEPSCEPSTEPLAPSAEIEPVKPPDVATLILRAWWERTNPRPAQPYVACLAVVRKMLMAGWSAEDVAWALTEAPVVSTGALTFTLNQRGKRKGTAGQALQHALDAMKGMNEVEQLEWWNTVGPGRLRNG